MRFLKKRHKGIVLVCIVFVMGLIVVYSIVSKLVSSQLQHLILKDTPSNIAITYDYMDVSLIHNYVKIDDITLNISDTTDLVHTNIIIPSIKIEGISIWSYWVHNRLSIDNLLIKHPEILHRLRSETKEDQKKSIENMIATPIYIEKVKIVNGNLTIVRDRYEKDTYKAEEIELTLSNLRMNSETSTMKIPFDFKLTSLNVKKIVAPINSFDLLKVEKISFLNELLITNGISMKTKYNPTQLSKKIEKERDHIAIEIPNIMIWNPKLYSDTNAFRITADSCAVQDPNIKIYRDKLIPDDTGQKKFYGKMLAELPFDLSLGHVVITNGFIGYKEKIETSIDPEEIYFSALQLSIPEFSNRTDALQASITSTIMGGAELQLRWMLPVMNFSDNFQVRGSVKNFDASSLNPFLKSNVRSEAKGFINEMYFTTSGNDKKATGDMKMKYRNFEFVVLNKDRLGVNKILTKIGNIFVNSGSTTDRNEYRYGVINVQRDPTKSFFNYLWLQVRDGIISTTTGGGKKKNRK